MPATGSTLNTLADDLLLSVDSYNSTEANDYSTKGAQGEQARRALNQGLQKIYSILKRYDLLEKEAANASLSTTANQPHVVLTTITDLDDIENIYETTNDNNLIRISFDKYRELYPDPSESTGNPIHYARRGTDRIYLGPTPDATYTLNIFYILVPSTLSSGSDTTSVPSKLDYWILAEARVFWQLMMDPADQATMNSYIQVANDCRQRAMDDLSSQYDLSMEVDSHWGNSFDNSVPRFDSPAGQ